MANRLLQQKIDDILEFIERPELSGVCYDADLYDAWPETQETQILPVATAKPREVVEVDGKLVEVEERYGPLWLYAALGAALMYVLIVTWLYWQVYMILALCLYLMVSAL